MDNVTGPSTAFTTLVHNSKTKSEPTRPVQTSEFSATGLPQDTSSDLHRESEADVGLNSKVSRMCPPPPPDVHSRLPDFFSKLSAADFLMALGLFAAFIGIFFFLFVLKIEESMVDQQVSHLVADFVGVFEITNESKEAVASLVRQIPPADFEEADANTEKHNQEVQQTAYTVIGIGFALCVVLSAAFVAFHARSQDGNGFTHHFGHILRDNVILLLVVAFTEFMFTLWVAREYKLVDPNLVKRHILDEVDKTLSLFETSAGPPNSLE